MTIAIITGASVGIGEATARAFQDGGYEVVNLSRRACSRGICLVPSLYPLCKDMSSYVLSTSVEYSVATAVENCRFTSIKDKEQPGANRP